MADAAFEDDRRAVHHRADVVRHKFRQAGVPHNSLGRPTLPQIVRRPEGDRREGLRGWLAASLDGAQHEGDGDATAPRQTSKKVSNRPLGCLVEIAETLVLTIVIFWLIQTFVAQPFEVKQVSMEATLEPGQYVLVDKLTPRFGQYARGDIIVFMPVERSGSCAASAELRPDFDGTPYIKRLIGEPGDVVELQDGIVIVNGSALDEPYTRGIATEPLDSSITWTVPNDRLFVLGDHRDSSVDSRADSIGLVCESDVIGRAWIRYWPLNSLAVIDHPKYDAGSNSARTTAP